MPLALIKEDGSALANANSYASAADGDAYHEAHLYASSWTSATTGTKEAALVMATRLLDSHFRSLGFKRLGTQARGLMKSLSATQSFLANFGAN